MKIYCKLNYNDLLGIYFATAHQSDNNFYIHGILALFFLFFIHLFSKALIKLQLRWILDGAPCGTIIFFRLN